MDEARFDRLSKAISAQRRTVLTGLFAGMMMPLVASARGEKTSHRKHKGKQKKRANAQSETCWRAGVCSPGKGANVSRCDLSGTTVFDGLDCTGCNISRANLRGANMRGARFPKANLSGACLVGADFTGATFANSTNLANAIFCRTIMPNGTVNNSGCGAGTACCPICSSSAECDTGHLCIAGTCEACDVCTSGCTFTSVASAISAAAAGATISVCPGIYQDGALSIGKNLTVVGSGSGEGGTVLSGGNVVASDAYLTVGTTRVVTLRDLAITGGNDDSSAGGAIRTATNSTLTLTRVRVEGNRARAGGGIFNNGNLTLEAGTVVTGNTATGPNGGGGVYNQGTLIAQPGAIFANDPNDCVDNGPGTGCPPPPA